MINIPSRIARRPSRNSPDALQKAWSHGRSGLDDFLMRSVADALMYHAHCSVELVRNLQKQRYAIFAGKRVGGGGASRLLFRRSAQEYYVQIVSSRPGNHGYSLPLTSGRRKRPNQVPIMTITETATMFSAQMKET